MKGIILAGGSGTRLYPITKGISKQLLPIYDKPMVYYPLSTLMLADIRDILIITTPDEQPLFKKLLGDGSDFGINLQYAIQEKPNGIAEAFIIAENFIGEDDVCLILGDNIFHGPGITKMLKLATENTKNGLATVFGYHVNDPERYGVVEFEKEAKIYKVKSIEEKPQAPKSNYAVVGLYFYPNEVVNVAKKISPSERGELEITSVNNEFLKCGMLSLSLFDRGCAWLDTGTFESLSEASNYIETIQNRQGWKVACLEEIAYNKKWITKSKLIDAGTKMSKNDYGKYILSIVNKEK